MSTSPSAIDLAQAYNACETGEQARQLRNRMHQDRTPSARWRVLPPSWTGTYAAQFGWSLVDMHNHGDGHWVGSGSLREIVRAARDLNKREEATA